MTGRIDDDELHAYVDCALPPDRARDVEIWLEDNAEDAARVRVWREQSDALHRLFDPVLDEKVPERLKAVMAPRRRVAPLLLRIAASALLLALGGAAGWMLRGEPVRIAANLSGEANLPNEALAAHVVFAAEIRHPVEVPASDHAHLVGWLSKRLGAPLEVPDLAAQGFSLVGGRLLPATTGPAAQFMYEDAGGRRLTIYLRRSQDSGNTSFRFAEIGDTAFRFAAAGDAQAFYWRDGGFGYALAGGLPREAMMPIAHAVYRQLAE